MKKITRREVLYVFLKSSLFITAGISVAALACNNSDENGDGFPSAQDGGNCTGNGTNITISSNHGHTMTLTATEVTDAIVQNYNLTTGSGHTHTVSLTSDNFTDLQANSGIIVTSSYDSGHSHDVVINCI